MLLLSVEKVVVSANWLNERANGLQGRIHLLLPPDALRILKLESWSLVHAEHP